MTRAVATAAVALALASCGWRDPPTVAACEAAILDRIVTPGTYERVRVSTSRFSGDEVHLFAFDAENRFGAPVRGSATCRMPLRGGEPDPTAMSVLITSAP